MSFFGLWNFSSIAGLEKILVPMADRVRDKLGDEKIVINNADALYRLAHAHPGQPLQLNMSRIH